jgi:hypothetical protein
VEVQIRSVQSATPRPPDLLDMIATLPQGHRTKADIDQHLADYLGASTWNRLRASSIIASSEVNF